jgi:surface protein
MRKVIIFLLLCKTIGAVFAPANTDRLMSAVNSCISETSDGSCPVFASSNGVMGEWDVSRVGSMKHLFYNKHDFNQDLSKWDVSNVYSLYGTFQGAYAFNSDISKWEVSKVNSLSSTFRGTFAFNSDISKWDVSTVTDSQMAFYDSKFDRTMCGTMWESYFLWEQNLPQIYRSGRYGCCNTHSYMSDPFVAFSQGSSCSECSSKQIPNDDTDCPKVCVCNNGVEAMGTACTTNGANICTSCSNGYYKTGNTCTECTTCGSGQRQTTPCTSASNRMCTQAFAPVDSAALKTAVGTCTRSYIILNTNYVFTYSCTGGCLGETMDGSCPIFSASNDTTGNPYGVMGDWDVSSVIDLDNVFYYAGHFNADISKWDVSKVRRMRQTFYMASMFNSDLSEWDVSNVYTLFETFRAASAFNSDISKWDPMSHVDLTNTFNQASAFNSDISKWDVSNRVTVPMYTFYQSKFNRTMCGTMWKSYFLWEQEILPSRSGRHGCCNPATYMSDPFADPFSQSACTGCTPPCGTGTFETTSCSSASNRVCTPNVCSCTNGVEATGEACTTHGANNCTSCSNGYYKNGSTCTGCTTSCGNGTTETIPCTSASNRVCTPNVCSCANGTAANGTACTTHAANICTYCANGYYNTNQTCTGCTTCNTGKRQMTPCTSTTDHVCTQNVCSCANGVIATGEACTTHDAHICASCSSEYYKTDSTCTECTTCGTGERQMTPCTSASNRVCAQNNCSCTNGTAANGTACTANDANICTYCDYGFYKNGTTCQNIDDCAPNPCGNEGECIDGIEEYTCNCIKGFTGVNCEECGIGKGKNESGYCVDCTRPTYNSETTHNASCANQSCPSGQGVTSDSSVWNASGANCVDCTFGYDSPKGVGQCADIDECAQNPCKNNATCTHGVGSYNCTCLAGYTGKNCSLCAEEYYNTNSCDICSDTCAMCTACDTGKRQTTPCTSASNRICTQNNCSCSNGTAATGEACTAHNANICSSCAYGFYKNGTTCTKCTTCGLGEYKSGTTCDGNGINDTQTCTTCSNGDSTYLCVADTYETGTVCNGRGNNDTQTCTGCTTCDTGTSEMTPCTSASNRVCTQNNCSCTNGTAATGIDCTTHNTNICSYCDYGFYKNGTTCQNIDNCAPNPCGNGGLCTDGIESYLCDCVKGFTGDDCDTCASGKGKNESGYCTDCEYPTYNAVTTHNASCADQTCPDGKGVTSDSSVWNASGANCADCLSGYESPEGIGQCADIDDCASNPCKNNGTCTDDVGLYNCTCTVGYKGKNCSLCAEEYYKTDDTCERCRLECGEGTTERTPCSSSSNRVCTQNNCSCANGTAATGINCITHNANICSSCATGFYKNGNTCTECSTCGSGEYRTGLDCDGSGNNDTQTCDTCIDCDTGEYKTGTTCGNGTGRCFALTIGASQSRTKIVPATVTTGFECPAIVDQNNWLNNEGHPDTFTVGVEGQDVTVTRTDKEIWGSYHTSWGMDLKISCCYNNIQTCTSCSNGNSSYSCMPGKYQTGALCSGSGNNDTQTCAECTMCGTGKRQTIACSSSSNRVCTQNNCSCANGDAATGEACTTHGNNICTSCHSDYYKTGNTCTGCTTCGTGTTETSNCTSSSNRVCTQNNCFCANGNAATGEACTTHSNNICTSCHSDYYKTGNTCTECLTCGTGTTETSNCTSSSNRVCTQNNCSCANGDAATGTACTTHGANICTSCSGGYYKTGNTCTGCTTCGAGTTETTACTQSTNRACTQNVCSCSDGISANGTACTTNEANICLSCDSGYYKNGVTCTGCTTCGTGTTETSNCTSSSNRVCTQNVCSCPNGTAANGTACTNDGDHLCSSCNNGYTKNITCVDINECAPQPCKNGGTCRNDVNDYTCTCAAGYDGKNCTNDIDDCSENPCQNGGECVDKVNSYVCTCVAGYDGVHCTNNIDDCKDSNTDVWVSEGDKNMPPYYNFYSDSTCFANKTVFDTDTEYTFRRCNNSTVHPFSIGGAPGLISTNHLSFTTGNNDATYRCTSHSQMVHNLTVTEYNPCGNGSCVDGIDTYTCQCDLGWTGTTCKNMNKCTCANGYGALGAGCPQIREVCTSCVNKFSLVGNRCKPNIVLSQTLTVNGVNDCNRINENRLVEVISDILQRDQVNITFCTQPSRNSRRLLSVNASLVLGLEVGLPADTSDSEVLITAGKMESMGTNSTELCVAVTQPTGRRLLGVTCNFLCSKVVCGVCNRPIEPALPMEASVLSGDDILVIVFAGLAMVVTTVQCWYLCFT